MGHWRTGYTKAQLTVVDLPAWVQRRLAPTRIWRVVQVTPAYPIFLFALRDVRDVVGATAPPIEWVVETHPLTPS